MTTLTRDLEYWKLKVKFAAVRGLVRPLRWIDMHYRYKHGVEGVSMKKAAIPSRDEGRTIQVHVYEKEESGDRKKPVLINYHGGGWVLDALGEDDAFCAQMAARLNCVVLDFAYRTTPDDRFPAAVHDAEDAARWLLAQSDRFDVDRVSISGFSAGGNLALATSWQLGPEKISSVTVFYPITFVNGSLLHKRAPGEQPSSLANKVLESIVSAYVEASQRQDPRVSVLLAPAERYPHTVLAVCGTGDTLHEDSDKLIQRLKDNGHQDAELITVEGKAHAFDKAHDEESVALAKKLYEQCAEAIERAWERKKASS